MKQKKDIARLWNLESASETLQQWKSRNFVADDVQLGVVAAAAAVLVGLDRHVPAYEPDGGREEDGPSSEAEM